MALHYTLIRERPSDVSRMEGQPHNGLASSLDTWFVDSLGFGLGGICHLGLRRRLWTYRGPLLGHDHDDHHWLWRHLPSAESNMTKLFATFYLPLAVIALADAVSDVQMIGMRRKIRETDYRSASSPMNACSETPCASQRTTPTSCRSLPRLSS